ncbi:hypothetical protein ACWD4V_07525 [Streptomyces tsukubensis]|uniref:hypothetical protein n=1 Tax=Streptomyces TaxID=1883 RepID=UPI0036C467A5
MALRMLGKDPESKDGGSPTIYLDDETDNYIVQGWKVLDAGKRATMGIPDHEDAVEIPRRVIKFFQEMTPEVEEKDGEDPVV